MANSEKSISTEGPELPIESILVITKDPDDADGLVMNVYGDRRHSYFIGVISNIIHTLQTKGI